ncbi:GNAT family N-acetyltransferase [Lederbergia sp. NSJ-179]|uniref:GNAT family N-acetyltransferase n=1 Tax=Lederbergia sp. NSJ-179 TaxID=2931402 RepID=UPI001FCF8B73|nr:GNAT family N-acetyltransferase [Lederbergia sp. NSJ-179]MCJ7843141.1 GNAT family N-acetyltransferase [Lederbergia sp. NSJ-179]
MKIVKLTSEYYEEAATLSMYAFQYELSAEELEKQKKRMEEQHILGIFDQGKLASKLIILPFEVYQQGKRIPMGGIAGVSSYPEYRRKGHIRGLMTTALEVMKEKGQLLSFLSPFSIDFYRRFGWEISADTRYMTIKKVDLSIPESKGRMVRLTKGEYHSDLNVIHEQYAQNYSGMLVRKQTWWLDHLQSLIPAIYYSPEGEPKGYLLYHIKENKMKVAEFIVLTHEARKGLWAFIGQHDSMVEEVEMSTSLSEPLPYMLKNPRVRMEVAPHFMARIVDVEGYLQQFTWSSTIQEPIKIQVEDPIASWNNGIFELSQSGVQKLAEEDMVDPDIQLTVNSLTALLLGYKTVKELVEIEMIQGRPEQITQLQSVIPAQSTYFPDFF